jgi:lysophospholipase L1-like esterase
MHASRRTPRVLAVFIAGAIVVAGSVFGGSAATAVPTTSPRPTIMAALGDSITQAIQTCSSLTSCAANSWSTGTTTSVNSHAARLRALTPTQPLTTYNDAVSGATSNGILAQATKAVSQGAQYVTIQIGANDACTRTVGAMTPTATYKANIDAALAALAANGSNREIFVASVPNLLRMYELNRGSSSARFTWSILGLCQSLLANPSSTKPADTARRAAVQARVNEYNAVLATSCAATVNCRFDGGAVAGTVFDRSHISTRDYFHPSLSGQALLANVTWPTTQWVS